MKKSPEDITISPELQRKFDQQALRSMALKYDLKPSQVRAMRDDIRYMIRKENGNAQKD